MKSIKHYTYELRKAAAIVAESTFLLALLALRTVAMRFSRRPTAEEAERAETEAALDEALRESFPASDTPSPVQHPS
jgi:hypothetical protein